MAELPGIVSRDRRHPIQVAFVREIIETDTCEGRGRRNCGPLAPQTPPYYFTIDRDKCPRPIHRECDIRDASFTLGRARCDRVCDAVRDRSQSLAARRK